MTRSHGTTFSCPSCGETASPGSPFCLSCGARLPVPTEHKPLQESPPPPVANHSPPSVGVILPDGAITTERPAVRYRRRVGVVVLGGILAAGIGVGAFLWLKADTPAHSVAGLTPSPSLTNATLSPPPSTPPTPSTAASRLPAGPESQRAAVRLLVGAWSVGDRAKADDLAAKDVVDLLFTKDPPGNNGSKFRACKWVKAGTWRCGVELAKSTLTFTVEEIDKGSYRVTGVQGI